MSNVAEEEPESWCIPCTVKAVARDAVVVRPSRLKLGWSVPCMYEQKCDVLSEPWDLHKIDAIKRVAQSYLGVYVYFVLQMVMLLTHSQPEPSPAHTTHSRPSKVRWRSPTTGR